MRKAVFTLVLVLVSALGVSVDAVAAPVAAPGPIELRSRVIVKGNESASVLVRIPRAIEFHGPFSWRRPEGPVPEVKIVSGSGRFVGLAIVPTDYDPGSAQPIVVGQFRKCSDAPCRDRRVMNFLRPMVAGAPKLPAGDYRLHLLTDGSPVEIHMELDGLSSGTVRLRPDESSHFDLQTPQQTVFSSPSHYWEVDAHFNGGKVGLWVTVLWARFKEETSQYAWGICSLEQSPPVPMFLSGPACSGMSYGLGSGAEWVGSSGGPKKQVLYTVSASYHDQGDLTPFRDGSYHQGIWFTSPEVPIEEIGATTFFIEFGETWKGT